MDENNTTIQIEENENGKKMPDINDLGEMEEMFKAGLHFAYAKSKRNPKMSSYIYGTKNNTEIFDLEKTSEMFDKSLEFVKKLGEENKQILLVGTKPGIREIIKRAGEEINSPFVTYRWIGGTLTNFKVIRGRVSEYEKLKSDLATGNLDKYTKKERVKINKEIGKMEKNFNGLSKLTSMPPAMFIIDPKEELTALREAKKMLIPVIAVLNSDCNPTGIDYPIPANDAAPKSVEYIVNKIISSYKKSSGI